MLLKHDLREMTSRWNGSFIGVQKDGAVMPFMVSEFRSSDDIDIPFMVGNFPGKKSKIAKAENLVFTKPKLGMLNFKDSVVYITNIPLRQYRRGLTTKTLKMEIPFSRELKDIRRPISRRNINDNELILEMFNPTYPSVQQCIADVRGFKKIAEAFNNKYAIGIKKGFKSPRVYYKGYNIGRLDDDNVVHLRTSANHLIEELSQYLQCVPVRGK